MKPSALTLPPRALEQRVLDQAALQGILHAEWNRLNGTHFGGRLRMPEIVLSTRKTYGGYYQPARHRIVLSWQAYLEHGLAETLNTFRHEVAHVVHPNHSAAFWTLAQTLGVTKRHAAPPLVRRGRRYVYACPACKSRIVRRRRLRAASCTSCDSRYNPAYALLLVATEAA